MWYKLVGKIPTPVDDIREVNFDDHAARTVARDEIDGIAISTVFLGLDHGFGGESLFFETMIFGGEHDESQWRYATWEQAEIGHAKAVALVKETKRNNDASTKESTSDPNDYRQIGRTRL